MEDKCPPPPTPIIPLPRQMPFCLPHVKTHLEMKIDRSVHNLARLLPWHRTASTLRVGADVAFMTSRPRFRAVARKKISDSRNPGESRLCAMLPTISNLCQGCLSPSTTKWRKIEKHEKIIWDINTALNNNNKCLNSIASKKLTTLYRRKQFVICMFARLAFRDFLQVLLREITCRRKHFSTKASN